MKTPLKILQKKKEYYLLHREEILLKLKIKYPLMREKLSATRRKRYAENPEKVRIKSKEYYVAHKDEYAIKTRIYRKTHPEIFAISKAKRRAKENKADGTHTLQEWETIKAMYGNQCLSCGQTRVRLSQDHVIPISKGGNNNITNIQPLCHHCNTSKRQRTIDYRPNYFWADWT